MRNFRAESGSTTIEGVAGLWLIVLAIGAATFLLTNVALAIYSKEKLGFVANQAADYAAVLPQSASRRGLVLIEVKQLLASMGVSSSGANVIIEDSTVLDRPAVKVTVQAPFSTFACNITGSSASLVPPQITMSDSAVAVNNGWYPAYVVVVNLQGQKQTGVLINADGSYPNDALPVYGFNFTASSVFTIRVGSLSLTI